MVSWKAQRQHSSEQRHECRIMAIQALMALCAGTGQPGRDIGITPHPDQRTSFMTFESVKYCGDE
jgi:hypothetical protein